ncbi:MAG: Spy/CpxP family protein refolding chaperone [Pseudomonadota bacterium]
MKFKPAFFATAALGAVFLVGSIVVADEPTGAATVPYADSDGQAEGKRARHHGRRHGSDMPFSKRMFKQLDLSPEQQDAVSDVMQAARTQMRELHEGKRDGQQRLMTISPDDPNYAAVVEEIAQDNAELAASTTRFAAQVQADVWALLTDAQKAKAQTLKAEMQARAAERRSEWRERRQKALDAK